MLQSTIVQKKMVRLRMCTRKTMHMWGSSIFTPYLSVGCLLYLDTVAARTRTHKHTARTTHAKPERINKEMHAHARGNPRSFEASPPPAKVFAREKKQTQVLKYLDPDHDIILISQYSDAEDGLPPTAFYLYAYLKYLSLSLSRSLSSLLAI